MKNVVYFVNKNKNLEDNLLLLILLHLIKYNVWKIYYYFTVLLTAEYAKKYANYVRDKLC